MNTFEIIDRSQDTVTVKLNEELWNKFQKSSTFDTPKKEKLKNIIPVMLNKFNKWLYTLNTNDNHVIQEMIDTIAKIRGDRQNMAIKDLREICLCDTKKEYWIRFLSYSHAKESINHMKASTNKSLYEKKIYLLLKEIQNPRIRGQPYKNFISLSKSTLIFNEDTEEIHQNDQNDQNDSNDSNYRIYQESPQLISQTFSSDWDLEYN